MIGRRTDEEVGDCSLQRCLSQPRLGLGFGSGLGLGSG